MREEPLHALERRDLSKLLNFNNSLLGKMQHILKISLEDSRGCALARAFFSINFLMETTFGFTWLTWADQKLKVNDLRFTAPAYKQDKEVPNSPISFFVMHWIIKYNRLWKSITTHLLTQVVQAQFFQNYKRKAMSHSFWIRWHEETQDTLL